MFNTITVDQNDSLEVMKTALMYFGGYTCTKIIETLFNNSCGKRSQVVSEMIDNHYMKKIPIKIYDQHIYQITKKLCVLFKEQNSNLYKTKDDKTDYIKNNLRKNIFASYFYKENPSSFNLTKNEKVQSLLDLSDEMGFSDLPYRYFGTQIGGNKRMIIIEEFIQTINNTTNIYFIDKDELEPYYILKLFLTKYSFIFQKAQLSYINPTMVFFDFNNYEKANKLLNNKSRSIKLDFTFYNQTEIDYFFEYNYFFSHNSKIGQCNKKTRDNSYKKLIETLDANKFATFELYVPVGDIPQINTCLLDNPMINNKEVNL